jgi:DNA-directed RNA polymerase subunit RPC12/RpoP
MKEFIYTCEHCGAEFKIIEPGEYKCNKCKNTFVIEKEQNKYELSQDEMNDIQKRIAVKQEKVEIAKKQEQLKQELDKIKVPRKRKNKYYGEKASLIMLVLIFISLVFAFFPFVALIADGIDENIGVLLTSAMISDAIIIYIAYKFFGLFQRIEYHLRTMTKEDLDE